MQNKRDRTLMTLMALGSNVGNACSLAKVDAPDVGGTGADRPGKSLADAGSWTGKKPPKSSLCLLTFVCTLASYAMGHASGLHLTPECTKYQGGSCALVHSGDALPDLLCHTGDGAAGICGFDMSELQACPLAAEGRFDEHQEGSQREGTLCEGGSHEIVQLPSCEQSCCSGDLSGAFSSKADRHFHLRPHFQPHNATCTYHSYSWRQAEQCLAGSRVVIAGDSIMRQFFNRAVSLFRGQEISMDYNKHAHAQYMVCRKADRLEFGTFEPQRWEVPLEEVATLYSPEADHGKIAACASLPMLEIDYLWAPRHMDLVPTLSEFDASIVTLHPEHHPVYITFAGFWEDKSTIPEDYLKVLETIRQRARMLIIMGVPLERVYSSKKDNTRMRNQQMQEWAAGRSEALGGNVLFLDFDHLSRSENAPQGVGSLNWHYQCFLDHNHVEEARTALGNLDRVWHWQEAPDHLYPSIWTDDEGKCLDEMDTALWQVVLNMICNQR